jgi:hypothetical protein
MAGLARWGELHRLALELYRKRIHANNTHANWFKWPTASRLKAWQVHCLDMVEQALQIEAPPQDLRLLWAALIERLLSSHTAGFFLPISELTRTDRANVLTSFLERARTSLIDIPAALDAPWSEIDNWTKGFCWTGSHPIMLANPV